MPRMPKVMAIVNASPDSFSGSAELSAFGEELSRLAEVVDVFDIGGQSLRTDQREITCEEEIRRIRPYCELAASRGSRFSVDTYRSEVAQAAVDMGASMINDPSGMVDLHMSSVVAASGVDYVLTHNGGAPKVRTTSPAAYPDGVFRTVNEFLTGRGEFLKSRGVMPEKIVFDPGPDLGKTPSQTAEMLSTMRFDPEQRTLFALSRKDFIGSRLEASPKARDIGSLAAFVFAVMRHPNCILRTHRVDLLADAISVIRLLTGAERLSPDAVLSPDLRYEMKSQA